MSANNIQPLEQQTGLLPRVHTIVHPGFDQGEHPEFEKDLLAYIDDIAGEVHDILLFVSDGEMFDEEQQKQFAHLKMIENISLYIGLHSGGIGDMIEIYDDQGRYSSALVNSGLNESFYRWGKKHIDLSELEEVATRWRRLKQGYFSGEYSHDEHQIRAENLREEELRVRVNIDISRLANQACEDFGVLLHIDQSIQRNIRNKGRFIRLYQHAMKRLGSNRIREVFIADAEKSDNPPIEPVSHFQTLDGKMIPTPIVPPGSGFRAQVFNASEEGEYGNASELRDQLTYELSISRYKKLVAGQVRQVLQDMSFPLTSETQFIFSGEYRDRCVSNVAQVFYHRLQDIPADNFLIVQQLTLQRSDDRAKEENYL